MSYETDCMKDGESLAKELDNYTEYVFNKGQSWVTEDERDELDEYISEMHYEFTIKLDKYLSDYCMDSVSSEASKRVSKASKEVNDSVEYLISELEEITTEYVNKEIGELSAREKFDELYNVLVDDIVCALSNSYSNYEEDENEEDLSEKRWYDNWRNPGLHS